MIYEVPKEEYFLEVKASSYICDKCNKAQSVKPKTNGGLMGYLEPCHYCGCRFFYGFK